MLVLFVTFIISFKVVHFFFWFLLSELRFLLLVFLLAFLVEFIFALSAEKPGDLFQTLQEVLLLGRSAVCMHFSWIGSFFSFVFFKRNYNYLLSSLDLFLFLPLVFQGFLFDERGSVLVVEAEFSLGTGSLGLGSWMGSRGKYYLGLAGRAGFGSAGPSEAACAHIVYKVTCLKQLNFNDAKNIKDTYLYKLSLQ